ncbi:hypothetical protein NNJEOMEG_01108 [Fundidesulfovibrio magnetotacticus]|uniref:Xylose isomerase-like TIM barrel domain-containing protein n=1 Tax=Fundidesulfovibrio magnetotacticus TaxID=2730080 RepID=A0A6V8LUF9_9BACT|nr:metabolite traffic protein EboE [Fundidesulfovibrio magnetotacticus]GFK93277.1 hypothetical protein NNJEOMEG_01108 [Fundidesulfovibrio magnetotacticus]
MSRQPVTYCTNIHPGESWAETFANLQAHTLRVKDRLSPDAPFPMGLRLSGRAARELDHAEALRFRDWMEEHGLCVSTVNGFPYGTFHAAPVKEQVYLPDWRDPARAAYTLRLAEFLALWLPEGDTGSVSTVPVGFRAGFDPAQEPLALEGLRGTLRALRELAQRTGRTVRLAVEPEPGCLVETTPQLAALRDRLELSPGLAPHFTACVDCCHQALQYEAPAETLAALARADLEIGHVQVSSALHLDGPDLTPLARFHEPVYLHQCAARLEDGAILRFDDLDKALAARPEGVESWRVHFHVPVFLRELPGCLSTRDYLEGFLPRVPGHVPLEVETYTFDVLPEELKEKDVVDSIEREIRWVEGHRG